MDQLFKRMLRFRELRRAAAERKRRISNLVANSNCIGTTAHLFRDDWARTIARNLKINKKVRGKRTSKN